MDAEGAWGVVDDVVRDRPCGDDVGVDHFWSLVGFGFGLGLALAWVWVWPLD